MSLTTGHVDPSVMKFYRKTGVLTGYGDPSEWENEMKKNLTDADKEAALMAMAGRHLAPQPRDYPRVYTAPQRTNFPLMNTYAMGKGDFAENPLPRMRTDHFRM